MIVIIVISSSSSNGDNSVNNNNNNDNSSSNDNNNSNSNSGDTYDNNRPRASAHPSTHRGNNNRLRVNMVGVNMVLAEFVKFKHRLYKSCGIEWFEGTVLEPCLLQPCFHVAGIITQYN